MKIINIKDNKKYLIETIKLSKLEWGTKTNNIEKYIKERLGDKEYLNNIIFVLGLINKNELVGFISLFKQDGLDNLDLSPWYATMYVKKEYRGKGYSKMLNDTLLKKSKEIGYKRVYLKTTLVNYYEKFGAKYIKNINQDEKLYYIDL